MDDTAAEDPLGPSEKISGGFMGWNSRSLCEEMSHSGERMSYASRAKETVFSFEVAEQGDTTGLGWAYGRHIEGNDTANSM